MQSNNINPISHERKKKKSRNSSCTSRIFKGGLKTAPCSVNELAFGNLENRGKKRSGVHSPQMRLDSKSAIFRQSYNTIDARADLQDGVNNKGRKSKAKLAQLKSLRAKAQQIQDEILKLTHGGTNSTDT